MKSLLFIFVMFLDDEVQDLLLKFSKMMRINLKDNVFGLLVNLVQKIQNVNHKGFDSLVSVNVLLLKF